MLGGDTGLEDRWAKFVPCRYADTGIGIGIIATVVNKWSVRAM